MKGPVRRVVFNPTSIPELRTRAFTQSARTIPGREALKPNPWVCNTVRNETTAIGKDASGHIDTQANEAILFFDNIYPLRLGVGFRLTLPFTTHRNLELLMKKFNSSRLGVFDPIKTIKQAIPESVPIQVKEIIPRLRDGGAFVKFSYPEGLKPQEVEGLIIEHLKMKYLRPWFNPFRPIKVNLVKGVPFLSDLKRYPSSRLRVEFTPTNPGGQAAELGTEQLYTLFRRYGKIAEITPQPFDSKALPRFAFLDFSRLRNAVMARNCMHGFRVLEEAGGGVGGTQLRISYIQKIQAHTIRDWLLNHPRIVIPLVAALLGTLAVAVFDPIRTFFVKAHVTHSFHIQNSAVYKWFSNQAQDIFTFKDKDENRGFGAIWDDRKDNIEQLQTWMMETADTFIVVQGPRGSGKRELVIDQALKDRKNILVLDCKAIQDARGDAGTINAMAEQVGYKPVFSWMNSFSSLVDLAAQGTIGVKSGFSETLDTQLGKILSCTAAALKDIALGERDGSDKDATLSDDDYLDAHPERRPTVIIDNFLHKTEDSAVVYDKICEWAASLTTSNIAHVIFLTNDISYSKVLGKALPDRVFRQIALGDITPDAAKRFLVTHLESDENPTGNDDKKLSVDRKKYDISELDAYIEVLGGRLTDLEFLARRLKTGQSPQQAVGEIISQSASEIMKMFLLSSSKKDDADKKMWSPEQVWYLIENLAEKHDLRYNETLLTDTFKSSLTASAANGEAALEALSQTELITIKTSKGRPESIRPGKPVYQAAFKQLTQDKVLKARLDLAILTELAKIEAKNIDKCESELAIIAKMPRGSYQVGPRWTYLLDKVAASQTKIENWEKEMSGLKKILNTEY